MGYFATKRGERIPADKDKSQAVDFAELGKLLIAWQSQRPNISYSETKIFDKYFEQLFRREYPAENIFALNRWMQAVMLKWGRDNPLSLNETLLVMRAYRPVPSPICGVDVFRDFQQSGRPCAESEGVSGSS